MITLPFWEWFGPYNLVGGDWPFFWPENIREIFFYSFAWDSSLNTGIGKDNLSFLWLNSYLAYLSHFFTQILHIPWNIAEKIIFFWPIVILSFLSAFFLSRIFIKNRFSNIISGLIYLTNTYALMIFSGGQVGVSLAYSITPLVLAKFIKVSDFKSSIIAGLILALQLLFDPRIAFLSLIIVILYYFFDFRLLVANFVKLFIVPFLIVIPLHMFWILPILIGHTNPTEAVLNNSSIGSGMVKFLSFASFENSFSLLHPNWPENIFGKIGFMKPEFVLIPILAFSSLLFLGSKPKINNRIVLFFTFLGLLGAFLAKGSNSPFGSIYIWLTDHIGLFTMYRDPTKWYILVAVSYSVLIPYSVWHIYNWLKLHRKFQISNFKLQINIKSKILNTQNLFIAFVILYFIFLLRSVFLGQIGGTFRFHDVPQEYVRLKEFISAKPEFFRTLWIPKFQRFGLSSNNHPAVSWEELFGESDSKGAGSYVLEDKERVLQEIGIRYVIVPFDSEAEIFLQDRKYNEAQYSNFVKELRRISFLKEVEGFTKIKVFQINGNMDHFWIKSLRNDSRLIYAKNNPTEYSVNIENAEKGDVLVFAEGFSPNWIAIANGKKIASTPFNGKLNSFRLPNKGSYALEIQYLPAQWARIGSYISLGFLILISGFLFTCKFKSRNKLS